MLRPSLMVRLPQAATMYRSMLRSSQLERTTTPCVLAASSRLRSGRFSKQKGNFSYERELVCILTPVFVCKETKDESISSYHSNHNHDGYCICSNAGIRPAAELL